MVCVDEAVVAVGIVIAACPWYKAIWQKIKHYTKGCAKSLWRIA